MNDGGVCRTAPATPGLLNMPVREEGGSQGEWKGMKGEGIL